MLFGLLVDFQVRERTQSDKKVPDDHTPTRVVAAERGGFTCVSLRVASPLAMSRLGAASPREAARRCEATGWDDLDAVDDLASAFERELEGCRVAPLASRADALCAVLRVALDDDALDPASALERETRLVEDGGETDPTLDPSAPTLSPLASRLVDAVGDRLLGAIVVAADAAGTPEAEALACVAARAVASACAPRDAFLMTLERLQARARQLADRDEDAPPRVDDDDDDDDEARSPRGWRLAGALAESLGTLLRRLARDPTRFISDAAPLARALALAADERQRDDDDDREHEREDEVASGWGSPRDARAGIRAFVLAALDRLAGVALERRVSSDDGREDDSSPNRTVAVSALSLLALDPGAEVMSATTRALAAAGATRLDTLLALVDRDGSYSDRDGSCVPADAIEGAARVARAWFVAGESVSPFPSPHASAPLAGVHPTLSSLAPLVHALFTSPRGVPSARVRTLASALELAALGFRRAARGEESAAALDAAPAARRVVDALAYLVAASHDPAARETARLALSRALACADSPARFRLVSEMLAAPPPSPAVAAMLLTRATRDATTEWGIEPARAASETRGEKSLDGETETEPRTETDANARALRAAFATPEALALVERQIHRAIGVCESGETWPPVNDPVGAADVLGAALNYVRFATMRARAGDGVRSRSRSGSGSGPEDESTRDDRAGAWRRRREVIAASVVPARAWAARRLDAIVAEEAGGRGDDEDGEPSRERAAWEAQMGLHHVVEVCDRVVEFVREEEAREGIAQSTEGGEASATP